ncbi:carbohydrate kinase [Cyanobium gracile]|uniref:Carbohydrate kinase n=1 Tax=Cyanobium gracile UHCC 0281 TaxID=3110309 RepID=A0ABU5SSL4_9CYAN|nr:carbohydrate kinase [Cyanobium gracile]MEA5441516.1 carbohydrate kinase [Cyanobium gracile UHCC 0281]
MQQHSPITIFGEVLFDCFPDGSEILGGAPFNVAWHLSGFGLSPRFVSRVGMDRRGERIRSSMQSWGLDDRFLQSDASRPTGRVMVTIDDNEPHYDIVPESAYDFIEPPDLSQLPAQAVLYHGSLALRHPSSAAALAAVKAVHQGPIFLDVNLRTPWWSQDAIHPLLDDADHVKLNEAELALLTTEGPIADDAASLCAVMRDFSRQHGLTTLIVTRGAQGAMLCSDDQMVAVGPAPDTRVVDTVGAGDAFSAAFLLGLTRRWSLSDSLDHARDFAAALVSRQGATIDDRSVYQQFLTSWGCH